MPEASASRSSPKGRTAWRWGRWWMAACFVLALWLARGAIFGPAAPERDAPQSIAAARAARDIDTIRVGQRVIAENPDPASSVRTAGLVVDPATWRKLTLRIDEPLPDGTRAVVDVEMLQPPEWIAAQGAEVGSLVSRPIDLVEMGMSEDVRARVVANEPCPGIESGPGCVVLTTMSRPNNDLFELTLEDARGHRETFRPTGFHKFYSLDRAQWTNTRDLRPGERLRGIDGPLTLIRSVRVPGLHRVYNMTVAGEHVFHVTSLGLLSHNNNPSAEDVKTLWKAPQPGRDPVEEITHGFDPNDYPDMGPFLATDKSLAEQFQDKYKSGMQQINLPQSDYDDMVANGVIMPDPYYPGSAIHVPELKLPQFNNAIQQGPPNIYHPEDL